MSQGKLAAVCTHVGKELGKVCGETVWQEDKVVVLSCSDSKFNQYVKDCEMTFIYNNSKFDYHIHTGNGIREVEPDTQCAIGWIEED